MIHVSVLQVMLATNEHVQKGKGKGKWPIHVATKFLVKPGGCCSATALYRSTAHPAMHGS
jgi:hypothetical protein